MAKRTKKRKAVEILEPHELLFPQYRGARWRHINLDHLAYLYYPQDIFRHNPLVDPERCQDWVNSLHENFYMDFSYGGYKEDRGNLWRGHYMDKGQFVHLGVDYNVPAGTVVHSPLEGVVAHVSADKDVQGGWGGRVLLDIGQGNTGTRFMIFAHLSHNGLPAVGTAVKQGDELGVVGHWPENGNWFHHLHVQRADRTGNDDRTLDEWLASIDGYGYRGVDYAYSHPNPEVPMRLAGIRG